ncbi:unnamed protein product [Arctia plantaginis]|uniref:DDE Tnp4 domain-containing protein n=1 Tax=Arctia plantaginis TaxID=874455 RepID=A0A8S1BR00_ARCPL|nr:unnamed protein product [Arctia plantaginis]
MTEFQELFNMPNTLGAVDGTHISIAKPSINHPTAPGNLFYNRKGFYSINCQIVCSAKGKIIGLNPNFPGSTHDAAIWRASTINHFFKSNFLSGERNQWLLGDKGYPLQPWLMTPLMAPTTEAERAYNNYALNDDNHYDVEIQDIGLTYIAITCEPTMEPPRTSPQQDGGLAGATPRSSVAPPDPSPTFPTIRGVEIGIVVLVLIVWIGAIALFFNRWGKIRMLLPYQPDYKQEQLKVPGSSALAAAQAGGTCGAHSAPSACSVNMVYYL